jgi:hypothetical protein
MYSLAKHSRAADEGWYLGYHPTQTWKAEGGSAITRPTIQNILEDHGVLPKAYIIISIEIYVK